MIRQIVISALIMLFISGCSAPAKKDLNPAHFTGENVVNQKYDEIKKQLTRSDSQYGFWIVEAYPYTKPLIMAQNRETGAKNMDSENTINTEIKKSLSLLVEKDTCFMIVIHSSSSIETAQFKHWRAKIVDGQSKSYELSLNANTDIPNMAGVGRADNMRWVNSGLGCVGKSIDLTKGFTLFVIPQLDLDYGQAKKAELSWTIATPKAITKK